VRKDVTVDVLIATFAGEKYIEEQLESLLRQTFLPTRVLVSDDSLTPATGERIGIWNTGNRLPIFLLPRRDNIRPGPAGNFEYLLTFANADFILFCDQDDYWLPEKIETSVSVLQEMEREKGMDRPCLFFSDLTLVDLNLRLTDSSMWKKQMLNPRLASNWRQNIILNVVTGCTIAINRAALQKILPFPECDILHDQWVACAVSFFGSIRFSRTSKIYYRQHATNAVGARGMNLATVLSGLRKIRISYNNYRTVCRRFRCQSYVLVFFAKKVFYGFLRLEKTMVRGSIE